MDDLTGQRKVRSLKINDLQLFGGRNCETRVYVGHCPDLFYGGVCDAETRVEAYAKLVQIVEEDLASRAARDETAPPPRPRPGEAGEKPLFWYPKERQAWKVTVRAFHALELHLEPDPHHELFDGTIYVLPIPSFPHSLVLHDLYRQWFAKERTGLHAWSGGIILSPVGEPWPDLSLLEREPDMGLDNPAAAEVRLVIEVAHPTTDFELGPRPGPIKPRASQNTGSWTSKGAGFCATVCPITRSRPSAQGRFHPRRTRMSPSTWERFLKAETGEGRTFALNLATARPFLAF